MKPPAFPPIPHFSICNVQKHNPTLKKRKESHRGCRQIGEELLNRSNINFSPFSFKIVHTPLNHTSLFYFKIPLLIVMYYLIDPLDHVTLSWSFFLTHSFKNQTFTHTPNLSMHTAHMSLVRRNTKTRHAHSRRSSTSTHQLNSQPACHPSFHKNSPPRSGSIFRKNITRNRAYI